MAEESDNTADNKKGAGMKIVLVFLVVLVIALAGGAAFLLFGSGDGGQQGGDSLSKGAAVPARDAVSSNFVLETFVVNLNDPGGKRYLKTNIELEYLGSAVGEELEQRLPQLRDVILLLLSSKSLEDIQSVDGKIALRQELIQRVNQILSSGKIRNLYFTQFVVQ